MIVKVDTTVCQGMGLCTGLAPDVFELDDVGLAVVKISVVEGDALDEAQEAAMVCPTGAITIEPDEGVTDMVAESRSVPLTGECR